MESKRWRGIAIKEIDIDQPDGLEEGQAKLIAISNCLNGIRKYDRAVSHPDTPIQRVVETNANKKAKNRRPLTTRSAKLLKLAWSTELSARLGQHLESLDLLQVSLHTLPVHAYYAIFSAARSATNSPINRKDQHQEICQRFTQQDINGTFGAFAVKLTGDPEQAEATTLTPPITQPSAFNPLTPNGAPADYVWATLRMARRKQLEKSKDDWKQKSRKRNGEKYKRLPNGMGQELAASLRPTTLMDFLYELRRSSNYKTTDEYGAEVDPIVIENFHDGLLHLVNVGLMTYEAQLARTVGANAVRSVFSEWSKKMTTVIPWAATAGNLRMEALAEMP